MPCSLSIAEYLSAVLRREAAPHVPGLRFTNRD
jgi:hypothetical protein